MDGLSPDILFLRVPPAGLLSAPAGLPGVRLLSAFSANGVRGNIGDRTLHSFWIGFGKRVRIPGPRLLKRLLDGLVRDLLDIGCGGALDPSLRRGDLVLSADDVPFDTGAPLEVRRHPAMPGIASEIAQAWGVTLRVAPILTHERAVLSRKNRLGWFERTGCAAVQMEHAWFLRRLQSLLPPAVYRALRVTHLVLITDAVPGSGRGKGTVRAAWDAIRGYALPGSRGVASLRREFLSRWPAD